MCGIKNERDIPLLIINGHRGPQGWVWANKYYHSFLEKICKSYTAENYIYISEPMTKLMAFHYI